MRDVRLYDVTLHDLSSEELDETLLAWLRGAGGKMIVTPNPEMILAARKDDVFREVLNRAHLSLPDGVGLQYATIALLGTRIRRHTGVDTVMRLASLCVREGMSVLIVGGYGHRAEQAANAMKEMYPGLQIGGMNPGDVRLEEGRAVFDRLAVDAINRFAPAVLIVSLGQAKQEYFMLQELPQLPSVKIAIGAGGAVDMVAGAIPRAPVWARSVGLEWAWRLIREPKRLPRILNATVVFPVLVAWSTLRRTLSKKSL